MSKPKTTPGKQHSKHARAKPINLALQGGGAHSAFTWGVLDKLLSDERIYIEGISGTSAGAMNAVVVAYGLITGGRDGARQLLRSFWKKVSVAASMLPLQPTLVDKVFGNVGLDFSPPFMALDYMTRLFSPYQLNRVDLNPLRSIVEEVVDFEAIRKNKDIKLFINATNVRTGKIKVFETHEMTLDMVMASACLPLIFKAVEIDGEAYWDGGYSGNPAIYPLIYKCGSRDVLLVQINPLSVDDIPTKASDIMDRMNEISFNATLMREMRAIAFVSKLLIDKKVTLPGYKHMLMHMVEGRELMASLGTTSKLNPDWDFLLHLHDAGNQAAADWLEQSYDKIGKESSLDIYRTFM